MTGTSNRAGGTQEQQSEKRPEYMITQDEWNSLYNMDQNDFVIDLLERVRSRGSVEHDAQVAEKERERVLDEQIKQIKESCFLKGWHYDECNLLMLDFKHGVTAPASGIEQELIEVIDVKLRQRKQPK